MNEAPNAPLELKQDPAAWGLDNTETEHDKKTTAAAQPDLYKLEAGQKFEVMLPVYRLATIDKVQLQPEPRAVVNCRSELVAKNAKGKDVAVVNGKWVELWGLRTIPTHDYQNDILAIHKRDQGPVVVGGNPDDVPKTTYVAVLDEQGRSDLHMDQSHLKNTRVMVVPDASEKPQVRQSK